MGGACSTCGVDEKFLHNFSLKTRREETAVVAEEEEKENVDMIECETHSNTTGAY
jgi:hypothetical protein